MSADTLERTKDEWEVRLCPLSEMADQIDKSPDKKMLVQRHPCYELRHGNGSESDGGSRPLVYIRKVCRGEDTNCPGHPDYH
jgi:hypothetical protein